MRMYRVIYDAINDVEAAIKGMLEKKYEEKIVGRAEVRKVITTPKVIVGGSYVKEGKITSSSKIRLIRNGIVVHEGEIDGLRRFKDDVKEVPAGYECGITLKNTATSRKATKSKPTKWSKSNPNKGRYVLWENYEYCKIQEFIKQEVSKMLLNELKDPRIGFVTVTDARITGDLRDATVYVSLFGSDEAKQETLKALKSATGYIRTEVGKRWVSAIRRPLCLKKIHPSITMKIDKILRDIEKKD